MIPFHRLLLPLLAALGFAVTTPAQDKKYEPLSPYSCRGGATRIKLLMEGGGNQECELAVARGLAWLAKQQKDDGSWEYDGQAKNDRIAATGMCLLPFLATGQTHKLGKYQKTVAKGIDYLRKNQGKDGKFMGSDTMQSHAFATIALCEAYGMTKDRALQRPAQAAISFIVQNQAKDGSWGFAPGTAGDTTIVGWQIQAIHAARLSQDIVVPDTTIKKAVAFLDRVSSGTRKAFYGLTAADGRPATAPSAVGLLCRYHIDGWGPSNAGLAEGVEAMLKKRPPRGGRAMPDLAYYYHATQVLHGFGGPEWKDWNEGPLKNGKRTNGMRDWLIELQIKKPGAANDGGWDPDTGTIGGSYGRLGTTAMALLTLEVYYRYLPLYEREAGGLKIIDKDK